MGHGLHRDHIEEEEASHKREIAERMTRVRWKPIGKVFISNPNPNPNSNPNPNPNPNTKVYFKRY